MQGDADRPGRLRLDHVDAMMLGLVVVWGTAFPVITVLERTLDPFQLTWYRYLPFPILYGAWLLARKRDQFRKVAGNDWLTMAGLGFAGVIGYHFSLNWAMSESGGPAITGATGAILVATTPLWTLLLSLALRRERLSPLAAAGSVLAFVGVVVIVAKGQGDAELRLAAKAAVAMLAPLSWALYSVFTKPLITRHGGAFVTGVTLTIGTAALVPLGISYGVEPLRGLDAEGWAWLLFLAILSTAVGYAVWNYAIRQRTASSVTTYIYLNPVVATVMGAWVLPALSPSFTAIPVTPWFIAGGALVIAGLGVVHWARVRGAAPPLPPETGEGARP